MLKQILLGSAMLMAIPAIAQTTGQTGAQTTTTQDHDPTMDDDATTNADSDGTVSTQVNGGVNTTTTGTVPAQSGTAGQSGMNHGTMNHGTMNHGTMNHGAAGTAGAMAGTGGPARAAGNYPPCSRTVTDSCIQTNERGRRR